MRDFQHEDLETINRWYRAHLSSELPAELVPKMGLIVQDTAAGFLLQTDTSMAFLERFVSNPEASPRAIALAFDQISTALVHSAALVGVRYIGAFSIIPSIEKRARRLGFKKHPETYAFLSLNLVQKKL